MSNDHKKQLDTVMASVMLFIDKVSSNLDIPPAKLIMTRGHISVKPGSALVNQLINDVDFGDSCIRSAMSECGYQPILVCGEVLGYYHAPGVKRVIWTTRDIVYPLSNTIYSEINSAIKSSLSVPPSTDGDDSLSAHVNKLLDEVLGSIVDTDCSSVRSLRQTLPHLREDPAIVMLRVDTGVPNSYYVASSELYGAATRNNTEEAVEIITARGIDPDTPVWSIVRKPPLGIVTASI